MESTADKITKAQGHFGTNAELMNSLTQHLNNQNYNEYSNQFSSSAKGHGIELTADEVSKHFGFPTNSTFKQEATNYVKDEAKSAVKDEATGRVEDELGNQLGVDLGGVGDAASEVGGFFKNLFGKKKK
jgi:hypothetical protein